MENATSINKKCIYHPNKLGVAYCKRCGGYICKECIIKVNDKNRCKKCHEDYISSKSNINASDKSYYCTNCGAKILKSHLYCYSCGKKIEVIDEIGQQEKSQLNDKLKISVHSNVTNYNLEIINTAGVSKKKFISIDQSKDIDVSNIPTGIYFVRNSRDQRQPGKRSLGRI